MSRRALLLVFLLCLPAEGLAKSRWWSWSDPAPHHASVVRVWCGQAGGTGVLIWASPQRTKGIVLTAYHTIMEGTGRRYQGYATAKAVWPSGYESLGTVFQHAWPADVCLLVVDPPDDAVFAPLADSAPSPGDRLEHCGFGGPMRRPLRRWWAKMTGTDDYAIVANTSVISGDSGGPVFNEQGHVVSIITGGPNQKDVGIRAGGSDWPLVFPAHSTGLNAIRSLTRRVSWMQGQALDGIDQIADRSPTPRQTPEDCPT